MAARIAPGTVEGVIPKAAGNEDFNGERNMDAV